MENKLPRTRKCKFCRNGFQPSRTTQIVCSPICAFEWSRKIASQKIARHKREERKELRALIDKAKPRAEHLREVQTAFNAWVRERDVELPCISCGRPASWVGQWDAGHYRSRGAEPALRFEPDNVHKQCLPCNRHLSGNLVEYRINLEKKIGQDKLSWLEGKHESKKLTVPELQEMKAFYRAETRRLKKLTT